MHLLNITRAREGLAQTLQAVNMAVRIHGEESDEYRAAIRKREKARAEMQAVVREIVKGEKAQ